jgi:hypothetical protein
MALHRWHAGTELAGFGTTAVGGTTLQQCITQSKSSELSLRFIHDSVFGVVLLLQSAMAARDAELEAIMHAKVAAAEAKVGADYCRGCLGCVCGGGHPVAACWVQPSRRRASAALSS